VCGVSDVFVVDLSGGGHERARREAERAAEHRRLTDRYARHLVESTRVSEDVARRVIAVLFGPSAASGGQCPCSCHPRLSAEHDDGFGCSCTWDPERRAAEADRRREWLGSPAAEELRAAHRLEDDAIAVWLAGQRGVDARRTSWFAPEQWEGTVDGRTFYFRERWGSWRIELDMMPSGRYAQRLAGVADDGEFVTEPVPVMEGEIIACGDESSLGDGPADHIAFIIQTIRDHLRRVCCGHDGARMFCPGCGQRTAEED
jgi:hypothetical protein